MVGTFNFIGVAIKKKHVMAGTPDRYALAASLTVVVVVVTQTEREDSIIKRL